VPRGNYRFGKKGSRGFSLFEMVVAICSIVILYMVAEERLNQLPGAAERANFYGVLQQVKAGVNFEMVSLLASGRTGEIRELEGRNPMDFLIEGPSNYRGELDVVTDAVERRNAWYFETSTGELVFVVGGASIDGVKVIVAGVPVSLGQIRFKLTNIYSDAEESGESAQRRRTGGLRGERVEGKWQALILAPVREFTWDRGPEEPIPVTN
jgi:hypothetical protein